MEYYTIHLNGSIYNIKREGNESNDIFLKRAWFIAHRSPTDTDSYKKCVELSLIWRNHTIYGVNYAPSILKLLNST